MNTVLLSPATEVAVWLSILHPEGELGQDTARVLLQLTFPESEKNRIRELSPKARAGTLTPAEDEKMDAYERAGALLSILKSKARQVLKKTGRNS